jgi:hypothetical protein
MATVNDQTQLVALFKDVFGDSVINRFPNITKISRMFDFSKAEVLGKKLVVPVQVAEEHGVTYAAGTDAEGSITLLDPTAGELQTAEIDGAQMYARSRIGYATIERAKEQGKAAFAQALRHVVDLLTKACGKRLEASHLHGRRGWGAISSVSGSGTTRAWVITEASWAAGLWSGSKNMTLDVFAAAYTGSKINSNAKVTVTAIARSTRTISVSGNATDLTNIVAGMHLFPESASPTTEFAGIDAILQNTGTLFAIDAATYDIWKANQYAVGGAISMEKILDAVRLGAEMGLMDDVVAIISPRAFQVLNNDLAALRRLDRSYSTKEGENGTEEILYHGQTGTVRIMPHLYQKDGLAFIINPKQWHRVGATSDFGFITRGGSGERLIIELPNNPASEMRAAFLGAIYCDAPSHQTGMTGITYS